MLLAEVAYSWADKTPDGNLYALNSDDIWDRSASRLVEACIAFFGAQRFGR
jgi:hypothetical protein